MLMTTTEDNNNNKAWADLIMIITVLKRRKSFTTVKRTLIISFLSSCTCMIINFINFTVSVITSNTSPRPAYICEINDMICKIHFPVIPRQVKNSQSLFKFYFKFFIRQIDLPQTWLLGTNWFLRPFYTNETYLFYSKWFF